MTFYVCVTAKRKNGKRHIACKCNSHDEAVRIAKNNINHDKFKVQVCSGDWAYTYHIN